MNDRANCSYTHAVRQVLDASIGAEMESLPHYRTTKTAGHFGARLHPNLRRISGHTPRPKAKRPTGSIRGACPCLQSTTDLTAILIYAQSRGISATKAPSFRRRNCAY